MVGPFPSFPFDTGVTGVSSSIPLTNPDFKYPDKRIKFLEAQRSLDKKDGSRPYELRRGYIKNLQPATLKDIPQSKCSFQFNPQEIRQSVSMREDIYNPVLLTAEQLSQPIGGSVTFQFDLFFDRSLEMAADFKPLSGGPETSISNEADSAGAEQVGVYADLRVLYDVIGQGININLLEQQLDNLKSAYKAKVTRDGVYESPSDDENANEAQTEPAGEEQFDSGDIRKLLGDNVGNRAFLIPNPVRIVFSKILMVDGFVTGTNVDFLKFNSDMVPMQCRVSLSVYAMYIGFAKQKTFLTSTLDTARTEIRETNKTDTELLNTVLPAIESISPFKMNFEVRGKNVADSGSWDDAIRNGILYNDSLFYYLMNDEQFAKEKDIVGDSVQDPLVRVGYVGFPKIIPVGGPGDDIDPILKIFGNDNLGQYPTITYEWGFEISCKVTQDQNNGIGWTQAEAAAAFPTRKNRDSLGNRITGLVGSYSGLETANSKEQWGAGTTTGEGGYAGNTRIRRRKYIGGDELSNKGNYNLGFGNIGSDSIRRSNIENSYYIIEYSFNLKVQAGTVEKIYTANGPIFYRVVKGNSRFAVLSNYAPLPALVTSAIYK